MQPPTLEHPVRSVDPEDARRQVSAILASDSFRRSERQLQFLRFICDLTLTGEAAKINEYLLAHEVFGRGPDYSPGEDSVVRRQAHTLRQKLQDYYSGEGRNDAVRIDIPVGRYVPVFTYQNQSAEALPELAPLPITPPPHEIPAPPARRSVSRNNLLAIGACAAVLFLTGWFAGRAWRRSYVDTVANIPASVAEIWGGWLHDASGAAICFSNPYTAVVKQFSTPVPENAPPHRIRMSAEEEKLFRDQLDMPPGGYLYLSPAVTQAKMGEAVGSIGIATLMAKTGTPVRAMQSRYLNWSDFRTQNLILLGHDEANRWLDPVLERLPLRLAPTDGGKPRRIINTAPQGNEVPEYHIAYTGKNGEPTQDYALISMVRSLDGFHRLLLINGLNTEGTEMACEFLTDNSTASLLLSELKKHAPNHRSQWHFQAVIKTDVHDRTPVRGSVVLLRVL